jgi:hypothetical protein
VRELLPACLAIVVVVRAILLVVVVLLSRGYRRPKFYMLVCIGNRLPIFTMTSKLHRKIGKINKENLAKQFAHVHAGWSAIYILFIDS